MLEWTQRRARRDGVAELVDTEVADVTALPFPDGCFDVVMVESVLAFVEDKTRAAGRVRAGHPPQRMGRHERDRVAGRAAHR